MCMIDKRMNVYLYRELASRAKIYVKKSMDSPSHVGQQGGYVM